MAKSWKIHPVAQAFPRLAGTELKELTADIKARGIRVPILVNKKKDTILDGRTRAMVAHDLKLKGDDQVPLEVFKGTPEEEVEEIISRNLHRRHLTDDQRIAILAKIRGPQLEKEAALDRTTAHVKGGKKAGKGEAADRLAAEGKSSQYKARIALKARKLAPKDLDAVAAGKEKLRETSKKMKAKAGKTAKPKPVKSLQERVEAKFLKFMESFAVTEYREVRAILRGLLAKAEK
jgi:ParB-like chromosome segregation protein Spo0J